MKPTPTTKPADQKTSAHGGCCGHDAKTSPEEKPTAQKGAQSEQDVKVAEKPKDHSCCGGS